MNQTMFSFTNDILNIFVGNINIRVIDIDGYNWFVAQDIAQQLRYRDASNMCRPHSMRLVKSDGKTEVRNMLVISEQGLNYLAMNSTKPDTRVTSKGQVHFY